MPGARKGSHRSACTCAECKAIEKESYRWPTISERSHKVHCPGCLAPRSGGYAGGGWTHSHINCARRMPSAHAELLWAPGDGFMKIIGHRDHYYDGDGREITHDEYVDALKALAQLDQRSMNRK